jgi:hypothetical protein
VYLWVCGVVRCVICSKSVECVERRSWMHCVMKEYVSRSGRSGYCVLCVTKEIVPESERSGRNV